MWFKKKEVAPDTGERKNLSAVIDRHMSSYIKVVNVNNSLKTGMIIFAFLVGMFNLFLSSFEVKKVEHIAQITFSGAVSAENPMGSATEFAANFSKAVKDESAKAIMIIANSGGGSPTQAESIQQIIAEYVAKPAKERKQVYVTVQEICASACVLAFAGVDKILAHHNSVIGSISVRMDGIALDKALKKFDIERKVITTGKYKDLFDPYRNLEESEKEFIKSKVMAPMHQHFVDTVKAGRGDKLDATNELLFTGMIWAGTDAIKIGLADAIQTTHQLEEELKAEHKVEEVRAYNRQSKFSLKNMLTSSIEDAISNTLMKNDVVISM